MSPAPSPDNTIAEQFRRQAALTPDAVAVIHRARLLSYREVDELSNRIAWHLRSAGVRPETLVGVLLQRSEMLPVALLGVLKAGGAYVPLDPSYPGERNLTVMEDSGVRFVLTSAQARIALPAELGNIEVIDVEDEAIKREAAYDLEPAAAAHNLAYVLYTSGSTGKPKGVMVEHRNVVNFFHGMDAAIGRGPGVWLAVTSVAFDISVLELLWTLTRGFTMVVYDGSSAADLAGEIARRSVTHVQMTPSLARMMMLDARAARALGSLQQILLGGEALPASLAAQLRAVFDGELYNMYGPTETTIWSTTYRVEAASNSVPIGRAIVNTQLFLLDEAWKPVAQGIEGELFIGGDGVARGYWARPELTAERFITIPELTAGPVYRTGDLARMSPDGNLEFVGRADHQIKLRGHRIEPGEIEALLEQQPGVRQAVVVLCEDKQDDARLLACLTTEGVVPDAAALKSALARRLPAAMIPAEVHFLRELPLTQNGKIDRKALLAHCARQAAPALEADAAANAMERTVADAWKSALGVGAVGLHQNFFDLGAHSLTVAEVQGRLQATLGREIPLLDLFQFSTVSSLAHHLAGDAQGAATNEAAERAERRKLARKR